MLWANGPVAEDVKQGHVFMHEHPFNAGQHVAHNAMLDEAAMLGYEFHARVDDDCFISTRKCFQRLLTLFDEFHGERLAMGIDVAGLNEPPKGILRSKIGREYVEKVDILGGIFRMAPMGLMRYFRWDERQSMGFGEARQFANYCSSLSAPLVRVQTIRCSHGGSTNKQREADPSWEYEHNMLQYIPLGL